MPLYVQLDVDFATNAKILTAGPVASYLYICSLAFTKRTRTDGVVKPSQLVVVAPGLPGKPAKHAEKLVEAGLWSVIDGGWLIVGWAERNMSRADIELQEKMAKEAGMRGNHERWHVGPAGKPSVKCPFCREGDRVPDRGGESDRFALVEVLGEVEEKPMTKGLGSQGNRLLRAIPPVGNDDPYLGWDPSVAATHRAFHEGTA